jgi:hypothetical protein
MEEIDHERAAFKTEQSKLEGEVSTVTCSLIKLTEDIPGIRCDMKQLSTNLHVELSEIKTLLLNMSGKKIGRKQKRIKDSEAASSSLGDQEG